MKLIKNGRVIDPKSQFDALADILIDGQKIVAIGQDLTREDAEIMKMTRLLKSVKIYQLKMLKSLMRLVKLLRLA